MWKKEYRRRFQAGEVIFHEGEPGDCAYVIENGVVEISVMRDGERIELAQRCEGELFGEMAIIDDEPRSATVTAVTSCQLLVVTLDQLQSRLKSLDPVLRMVFATVLQRFRNHLRNTALAKGAPLGKGGATAENAAFNAAIARIELEQELRHGIGDGQLEFHLQPIVRSGDHTVAGFETLARWRHPTRGLLPPAAFIEVAEEAGLNCLISRCAVDAACRDVARLRQERDPTLYVSANTTPDDICNPDFFEFVRDRLFEHGLEPNALCLEITETTLITKAEETLAMLTRYHELGVRISIDDFGSGYSNFSYLARYPVQCLKIDKSVVDQMADGERGVKLVRMIATMARVLGLKVVAEGVETVEQADQLRELGCQLLQGYYFGKPAPLQDAGWAQIRASSSR